jgi:hypothetical protein
MIDWVIEHAIALLWMGVVFIVGCSLAQSVGAIAAALAALAVKDQQSPEEQKVKARENFQRELANLRQQHWRERHRHARPDCAVCQHEKEEQAKFPSYSVR